ncbi:hypothetical protein CRG98_035147 [Punica granatum]|uniref:RNase H type-1 domain-containing protein n=1 Tax=Punica granatum TaxID=22663 RepID=A0A2I0IL49_PUNGR|nr:hypothetical protein CRG98_035147 [Punica granatum]
MGTTTPSTTSSIKSVLEAFCKESGMKINLEESKLLFSKNTCRTHREETCLAFNIQETEDLGKNLGFPISLSPYKERDFSFIVEKIQAKLAGWKSNMLSMAGRAVLINSTCATIPSYFMQYSRLPKATMSIPDKLNRDFPWGSTSDKKKLHLVSCEIVTQPKAVGGLGIPNMDKRNKALLGNLVFRASSSQYPWACLFRHQFVSSSPARLRQGSSNWKAIAIDGKFTNKSAYLLQLDHQDNAKDKTLCHHFDTVIPRHTYKEANKCADHLANLGVGLPQSLVILSYPPSSIKKLLLEDFMGLTTQRSVSALCADD